MSDLQKSFAKSKLAKLPPEPPPIPETLPEEDGESSASSTDTVTPSPTKQLFARPGGRRGCVHLISLCFATTYTI